MHEHALSLLSNVFPPFSPVYLHRFYVHSLYFSKHVSVLYEFCNMTHSFGDSTPR